MSPKNDILYLSNDLKLFKITKTWKKYIKNLLNPFINGDVLEVGAGIGGTTTVLCDNKYKSWTCLEPDTNQVQIISDLISKKNYLQFAK